MAEFLAQLRLGSRTTEKAAIIGVMQRHPRGNARVITRQVRMGNVDCPQQLLFLTDGEQRFLIACTCVELYFELIALRLSTRSSPIYDQTSGMIDRFAASGPPMSNRIRSRSSSRITSAARQAGATATRVVGLRPWGQALDDRRPNLTSRPEDLVEDRSHHHPRRGG